jgi:purine nucleosidase
VRSVLLDCDTGIDDAIALLYLLRHPKVRLVAATTVFGNVSTRQAARNTAALLASAGRADVGVHVGAESPLGRAFGGGAADVHGTDGLGDIALTGGPSPSSQPAAEVIVRHALEHPGRLDLVATGPLTNLALALQLEPRVASCVRSVTVMGGAAHAPGNVSAVAEANIACDPVAAAMVLRAPWPVTLVPLDATMANVMEEQDRSVLARSGDPGGELVSRMLDRYFDFYQDVYGRRCAPCHDALAAAIAVGDVTPELAPLLSVEVDQGDGPGRGQTICDLRGVYRGYPSQSAATCRVVLTVGDGFVARLVSRLSEQSGMVIAR